MPGIGNIQTFHRNEPPGAPAPPFAANSAYNGLSVDLVTGQIVIGQDIGQAGDPAQLVSNREIPLMNFSFALDPVGSRKFIIDPTNNFYGFGNVDGSDNGMLCDIIDSVRLFEVFDNTRGYFEAAGNQDTVRVGDIYNSVLGMLLVLDDNNGTASIGDVDAVINGTTFEIDDTNQTARLFDGTGFANWLFIDIPNQFYSFGNDIFPNNYNLVIDEANNKADLFMNSNSYMWIDITNARFQFGDTNTGGGRLDINDAVSILSLVSSNSPFVQIDSANRIVDIGDIGNLGNQTVLRISDTGDSIEARYNGAQRGMFLDMLNSIFRLGSPGGGLPILTVDNNANRVYTESFAEMVGTSGTAYTNNAGAAAGTLNNAPAAGDPTKWIPINDNGTIRNIPAW